MTFQSTLPRGERLYGHRLSVMENYFNPRSHAGSDVGLLYGGVPKFIFQSTLPRGERLNAINDNGNRYAISIHAPTRGATFQLCH